MPATLSPQKTRGLLTYVNQLNRDIVAIQPLGIFPPKSGENQTTLPGQSNSANVDLFWGWCEWVKTWPEISSMVGDQRWPPPNVGDHFEKEHVLSFVLAGFAWWKCPKLSLYWSGEPLPYLKYHHISHPALGVENMIWCFATWVFKCCFGSLFWVVTVYYLGDF